MIQIKYNNIISYDVVVNNWFEGPEMITHTNFSISRETYTEYSTLCN